MPEQIIERDSEELAAEVYAEMDAAEKGEVKDPKESEPTHKKNDGDEEGQSNDKSDEQSKPKEDGADGEANEDKADEKPDGDENTDTGDNGPDDKAITEYAEKNKMTYAEAKEDLEKTAAILKQYKNDPAEMAKAMRNKDREYHKLRTQVEKATEKKAPVFKRMTDDQFRKWAKNEPLSDRSEKRQTLVDDYRAKFPARSESMSDEAIVEEIVERELMIYKDIASKKETEVKETAKTKRDELIFGIAEADRRFIPDLKALLLETDDEAIINHGDTLIQDAMYMVKGKVYDADIKAAEERAIKRLKESPKILGTKGGGNSKPSSSSTVGLTENQKNIAQMMFGSDYDADKCYEMFKDAYKDELKKNPKFDPYKD